MSAVSEIMSYREPVTVSAYANKTAYDVASILTKNKIGSVIVIDRDKVPIGIITERDLVKRVCLEKLNPSKVLVEELMSSPLITIMTFDSVDTATRIMLSNKIKRLPVLESDNRLMGIISVTDITRKLSKILMDDHNRFRSLRKVMEMNDIYH
ncbi:MAG: cyclic nucleotide-binding/CBS domain-containing protein [Candidatus Nitrosocosmicus sp.]|jgi:signal-transduction protein with cAMP-binding, CBS, and nucleotidyltransferase domain|uniref:CBS domain-containing protein n=1 Tax=Candidatus Nitrosocosmicus agrestis TaxID=2563600 RepID=UPI00122E39A9|nr:CBS domain-containing protein [Candidatus Nitrosocosmicus sp. SS]KAA2280768.1 CBS domain-containing protein [Candidatus Nitrosocosmicus sp. SS]KAF0868853.1 CBS domain-containing protein [Candidatus Nitrosocosmicus sp. SS]MDR4492181.1 CBS domain-containing protein [Candidatus Nitrosocosmicus sp.]